MEKMLFLLFFTLKLTESVEWVPVVSPIWFQMYQMSKLRPPPVTSFTPLSEVDFQKPKTQNVYKSYLSPHSPPVYEFRYKVHDPKEENYQEKSETRVGDTVRGYYSVREGNGYVRLVKYVSDENGFQTQVSHHHADDTMHYLTSL